MEGGLQTLFQGADQKPAHEAGIAKPHFGLGRMHIDIDLARIAPNKQDECRMAALRQIIHVGRAHGAGQKLVADRPPVDEEILRLRIRLVPGRKPGIAFERDPFPCRVDAERIGAKLLANDIGQPREQGVVALGPREIIEARGLRAGKSEANLLVRHREALHGIGAGAGLRAVAL